MKLLISTSSRPFRRRTSDSCPIQLWCFGRNHFPLTSSMSTKKPTVLFPHEEQDFLQMFAKIREESPDAHIARRIDRELEQGHINLRLPYHFSSKERVESIVVQKLFEMELRNGELLQEINVVLDCLAPEEDAELKIECLISSIMKGLHWTLIQLIGRPER